MNNIIAHYRMKLACVAISALFWLACPVSAVERYWTGNVSANWSDPNNWSPVGVPQNYDSLWFGYNDDSHRTSVNDLVDLIADLFFSDNDYQVNGNALTLPAELAVANQPHSVTINCPLVIGGDVNIYVSASSGLITENTSSLFLNG